MNLSRAIQEALVIILCYDKSAKGAEMVGGLISPRLYDPYYREIAEKAQQYYETYKKPPQEHTLDIIDQLKLLNPDSAEIYQRIYESMEQVKGGINHAYVLDQASLFVRHQRLKSAISQAIDLLQTDTPTAVPEAEKLLTDATKASVNLFDSGIRLADPKQALAFLDTDASYLPSGVKALSDIDVGPVRKGLHVFMAPPNRGKTWWLIHVAKSCVLHRYSVCHITLEMSAEKIAQRYIQSFFSISKRDAKYFHQVFDCDDAGQFLSLASVQVDNRPHFQQPRIKEHLIKLLKKLNNRPQLYIKQFPTGSLTVRELKAYLDGLEMSAGFVPDLLVVDYADIMKVDAANYRHSLGRLYEELRGLAVERNIAIATASQSNRDSLTAKVITEGGIAEDFSKVATADTIITYNQTAAEKDLGLARLFVAKARDDEVRRSVIISQMYGLGQFCMDSVKMANRYWDEFKEDKDGD